MSEQEATAKTKQDGLEEKEREHNMRQSGSTEKPSPFDFDAPRPFPPELSQPSGNPFIEGGQLHKPSDRYFIDEVHGILHVGQPFESGVYSTGIQALRFTVRIEARLEFLFG